MIAKTFLFCVLATLLHLSFGSVVEVSSQDFVDEHNEKRAGEGAANMKKLIWNTALASKAQELAETCHFAHGMTSDVGGYSSVGQNLWAGGATVDAASVVTSWHNEIQNYDYDSGTCSGVCGHYTQVVWADSFEVGCAASFCSSMTNSMGGTNTNMNYVVCNYGPPGNIYNNKPYLKGDNCTKCSSGTFWCKDGFCDDSCTGSNNGCECAAACQNSGTINTSDCTCSCVDGWQGVDCSLCPVCKNTYSNCGDYEWACATNAGNWQVHCPETCNTCPAMPEGC